MSSSSELDDIGGGAYLPPPRQYTLKRNAHIAYFLLCLRALPSAAQGHDPNRITIAFFCLSALDLLGALETKTTPEQRSGWAEWIWSLQSPSGGFRGSTFMTTDDPSTSPGHLPSTYTALLCLAILRAPMDRLDRKALNSFLTSCQAPDGSFAPLPSAHAGGFQNDARMSYCAAAVCSFINDVSAIDVPLAMGFVRRCQTWEGGYASRPGIVEAQGGTTYCSVATLHLLSQFLPTTSSSSNPPQTSIQHTSTSNTSTASTANANANANADAKAALRWLFQRQVGGFQGRPGKLEDVCYSFWCGAAISILANTDSTSNPKSTPGSTLTAPATPSPGSGPIVSPNREANMSFLLSAQSPMGGFGKEPDDYPDPFHSYLALAAMSIGNDVHEGEVEQGQGKGKGGLVLDGLKEVDPLWNVTISTKEWLVAEMDRVRGL